MTSEQPAYLVADGLFIVTDGYFEHGITTFD
jgi:hypothetical protein